MDEEGVHVKKVTANSLGLFAGYRDEYTQFLEAGFHRLPAIGAHFLNKFHHFPPHASSDLASDGPVVISRLRLLGIQMDRLADDLHNTRLASLIPAGSKQRLLDDELRYHQQLFDEIATEEAYKRSGSCNAIEVKEAASATACRDRCCKV